MGYIYIMTNPSFKDYVKIGFANNVEERRKQLSTTAVPLDYEIYATCKTPNPLADKQIHKMIDTINPKLRVSPKREFFKLSPEDAYKILESIVATFGIAENLERICHGATPSKALQRPLGTSTQHKRPKINFYKCGLKDGDELVFKEDPSIVVVIKHPYKVLYKGELRCLSPIAKEIKGCSNLRGPSFFTYNGEDLCDLAARTQWKGNL